MSPEPRVHYLVTVDGAPRDWKACSSGLGGGITTRDPGAVTCRSCLRSTWGPHAEARRERSERAWERTRQRAKDKREAELAVLARHPEELEAELTLRALARIGS